MADILDNRPAFTIVMGCDGCGKTTWKRANFERGRVSMVVAEGLRPAWVRDWYAGGKNVESH